MDRGTFLALASSCAAFPRVAQRDERLPMTIGMNRCFVRTSVVAGKGRAHPALAWLDTGGGKVVLRRTVARALRLRTAGGPVQEDGQRFLPLESFVVSFGGVSLRIESRDALVLDDDGFLPGVPADMLFPVRLLRDHAVVFDYGAKSFGIDPSEASSYVPVNISPSGMARMPVTIGGNTYQMLLDTGASCTMLSQVVIDRLKAAHPRWKSLQGAFSDANMLGTPLETAAESLLVPQVDVAGASLRDVMVVSRPEGTFERWMSQMTDAPIVGSLGGNVLRNFAFTLDYPRARARFAYQGWDSATHGPIVPLTLAPQTDGRYLISAILDRPPYGALRNRLVGAELVEVDGTPLRHVWMWQAHALLRGNAGVAKHLTVARNGQSDELTVQPIDLWGP